jgi:tetratricopeptide (TPR) repeat protein
MLKRIIIVIILLTLIISPPIIMGSQNENAGKQAESEGDYWRAAENYELAASRLPWRGDLWEAVGLMRSNIGEKEEAINALEISKQENALSNTGWDLLGVLLWERDRHEDAFGIWQEGLQKYPEHLVFYNRLALYYREIGDWPAEKDAIEHWFSDRQAQGDFAHLHYRLGLLLMLDSPKEALDELLLAARLDGEFAPVVETLRTSLNLASLESDSAGKQILLGRGLALVGEWRLGAEIFTNATHAHPESASAWAWLGEAKQHIGGNPLPDLDKAISLEPNLILIRSLRSLYWRRQGNFEKALQDIKIVISLEPENAHWQSALGEVYALAGDLPPALAAYEKAISLEPENPLYRYLLSLFSVQYTVQLADVGLPAAQKALELSPENALYTDTLGWVYLELGQDESAESAFLRALELDPELASAYLHLGHFYLKHSHKELAYQALVQARDLSQEAFVKEQALRLLDAYFQE